ncbi:hypothetical protein ABTZ58_06620 [Streptomyces sp. NPDC094143]|uniref:hypothetical protein n=1 Tax=Streptomyces sp. NPDC094143 TaxID=3155310 RepID=UPI00331DE835
MSLRRIGTRAAAMVVTMIAAVLVPLAVSAPAQAAQDGAAGTTAWTPQISPLFSGEWVKRDVPADKRNSELLTCSLASGIACVAVGQGDGKLSVFHLFRCETRSLSNFVDSLFARNNQTGGAQVRFWGPTYSYYAPADGKIYSFPDYATYDFNSLDIC